MAMKAFLLLIAAALSAVYAHDLEWPGYRRSTLQEVGPNANRSVSVPCNASVVGSFAACYNASIKAVGNDDFLPGSAQIAYPTNGTSWGPHISGPYPDGVTYLLSWYTGNGSVGPNVTQPNTTALVAMARLSLNGTANWTTLNGSVITYKRAFTAASGLSAYNYLSPLINHVVLPSLLPNTTYFYQTWSTITQDWSATWNFTTVPTVYPLRIALLGDIGQTVNSSYTRDETIANKPDLILYVGDVSYADDYDAFNFTVPGSGNGTNQQRWDSWSALWAPLTSTTPMLNSIGNHEIESSGIAATINYTTYNFSYPTNYPFQSYSARWPVPGTVQGFGNITSNLYYSTVIAGQIKAIFLNNYVAFAPGSPQYTWAVKEFQSFNRTQTPWLFVIFHAPPYHTYYVHYKEQECFMSIYEDIFYQYGVDFVFNGHVHAYQRTHSMYKYQVDTCGTTYITIGDGGNVEGPYRNFVDERDPLISNTTYCSQLTTSGLTPNQLQLNNTSGWGPSYQRQAHPPNCSTLSWQPPYNVNGSGILTPLASNPALGFCQSAQPLWSAYRDPSFGHGMLTVINSTYATFSWFRNIDNVNVTTASQLKAVDTIALLRNTTCNSTQRQAHSCQYARSAFKLRKTRRVHKI